MKKYRIFSTSLFLCLIWTQCVLALSAVKIVVVTPKDTEFAQQIEQGIKLALSKLDPDGLFSFSLVHEKEMCDAQSDALIAKKIIDTKPDVVMGYACDSSAVEAQRHYRLSDTPFISLNAVSPALTDQKSQNILRLASRTDRHFKAFAQMLDERYADKKFLVLDDTSSLSEKFVGELIGTLRPEQIKILKTPPNQIEKNTAKISDSDNFKADFVIVSSSDVTEAVRLVSRTREAGFKTPIIGLDTLGTYEFSRMIGAMKEGVLFLASENRLYMLDLAPVLSSMRFEGLDPTEDTLIAYAGMEIFWQAMLKKRQSGEKSIVFQNADFQTIFGKIRVDSFGDVYSNWTTTLYQWQGNTFIPK